MADNASRAGAASYLTRDVLDYIGKTHAPHDAALERAYRSHEAHGLPAIQVQPSEGKLVGMLLRLVSAKKVVEVGTLGGYSAMHIARALPSDGHLWTCELDPKHARVARENLASAGLGDKVTVCEGPALETLATLEKHGPFCGVFIDADKGRYDQYGRWALANLRSGGLLLGDNAAFFGRLTNEGEPDAAAMRRFHEECAANFESVCIPTPDGVLLGVKR